ncbi:unnamed protein product, partial [marine sediment metagenome]
MESNKEIRSVIMLLDQTFGSLRFDRGKDSSSMVGIDLMPSTADALKQFDKSRVQTVLLVPEPLPTELLQNLKQFLPAIRKV